MKSVEFLFHFCPCKSILIMLCHSVLSIFLLDFWMQRIKLIKDVVE